MPRDTIGVATAAFKSSIERIRTLTNYRLYVLKNHKRVGEQEFQAEDTAAALLIAASLINACSDKCDSAELWDDNHRIDWRPRTTPAGAVADRQAHIIDREIALANSAWAIARSRQLTQPSSATKDDGE